MPDSPYVGLKPYAVEDALCFFGREQERKIITANLIASRLTLLYGVSGVGKSSVLRAGVVYHLRRVAQRNLVERGTPGAVVLYFNSWREDPMALLTLGMQEAIAPFVRAEVPESRGSSHKLAEAVQACCQRVDASLLIILDQFEEYFLYHPEVGDDGSFDVEFPHVVNKPDLRVSFLISIREDALAKLDRFKGRIPGILGNYLRIHHLDRKAAKAAIEKPIGWYNEQIGSTDGKFAIKPALTSAVLDQVQTGQVILGGGQGTFRSGSSSSSSKGQSIETPYLQMVMARLWQEERRVDSSTLRRETLNRLGGARQIVGTHLDKAMSALSLDEQNIAANIFHYLVTPSGTKIAQTLCDLAGYANLSQDQLAPLLEKLSAQESRILRPVESPADRPQDPRYQIFHDVLATPVMQWRAKFVEDQALAEAEHRAHEKARQAELETEARSAGRLRRLVIALAAVSLLAAIASIFALTQWQKATQEARLSFSRALSAAAAENLYRDPQLSILLALEAAGVFLRARESVPSEVIDVLNRAVQTSRERVFIHVPERAKVLDLAFTSDGERLTTIDTNGAVTVWDAHSGARLALPPAHEGAKTLSGDGRFLASVSDGKTNVWDTISGKRLLEIPTESGAEVVGVFFSRDASRLAIANSNSTVEVWDLRSAERVLTFKSRSGPVQFVAFDPDGKRLASGSEGGTTELWDASSGQELQQLEDHGGKVLCVAFSPDGQRLARSSADHTVRLWDLSSGKEPRYLNPIRSEVLRVAFSSNGQLLATAGADGTVRVWDGTGKFLLFLAGHKNVVSSIAFSPDGLRAATASSDGTIRIWDVVAPHLQDVQAISFSHDGTRIASVSKEGRVKLWDAAGRILLTFPEQKSAPLTSVSFSPDDKRLATGSDDGTVAFWETSSGKELFKLKEESPVSDIAFSPDGTRVATGTEDGMAKVWELSSRAVVRRLTGHQAPVCCVAYSQDGRRLATGSVDRTAKVWDIDSGKAILTTDRYDNQVTAVALSPDGSRFATSGLDGSAIVGEIANWHDSRRPLPGHTMAVMSIVFNGDGTRLATGSSDRTARVWDVAGHELFKFTHSAGVTDLDFSPDGRHLATGSEDGAVHVMPLDPEELLQLARSRVTRRLGREECQKYLHSVCPPEVAR
jgi:WD40 repeat protein